MNEISSRELSEILNKSRQALDKKALKENWLYKFSDGQGKGGKVKQYLIASLPAKIRAAIMKRQSDELAEKMPKTLPQAVERETTVGGGCAMCGGGGGIGD